MKKAKSGKYLDLSDFETQSSYIGTLSVDDLSPIRPVTSNVSK